MVYYNDITYRTKKMEDNKQTLLKRLRCIMDFPQEGINFRDITSWFADPECVNIMTEELTAQYKDAGITKVVGVESRGFLMGAIMSRQLGAGLVLARKPGKLPTPTISEGYDKEYGVDTIHISKDAITPNDVVLIHDDLLATGGTAEAVYRLVRRFNPKKIYISFLIEITDDGLHGRDRFPADVPLYTIITT